MSAFNIPGRLLMLASLCACAAPSPQVTQTIAGPTVVFEAGLGDTAAVWDGVRLPPGLGRFAWTREGYGMGATLLVGKSWPGDGDGRRSGAEVAQQLQQALARAGVSPPYILVGHSLGALYVLQFAKDHPELVAGIVLVDPRLPGFTDRCKAEGLRGCEIPAVLRLALSDTERLELDGVAETESALQDLTALRETPVTIMLAERSGLGEDPRWRAVWKSHAEHFAAGFSRSRVMVADAGHHIMKSAPGLVAAEIERLLSYSPETGQ